jgi:hypothetical protein
MITVIYNTTADAATTATFTTTAASTTNSLDFRMFSHSNSPMTGKHYKYIQ